MSHSHKHLLAMLPLFSILSLAPMHLESKFNSRSIASEVTVAHPKYEARAAKIDRTKIEIDKDLDLTCFSERGESLRERLMTERKEYKVDLVEKDGVAAQKARVEGLVSSLVSLEEDFKALKEKQAFVEEGEKIAEGTVNELKTTLESLLIDEMENELNVLKAENEKPEVEPEPEVKPEETKPEVVVETPKPQTDADKLCELEEKNKALSKQVEELLAQQKTIMQTMLGMNQMMVQMNQQMSQQSMIPEWMKNGSMMSPQFQYPYTHGTTIIMVGGQQSAPQQSFIGQNAYNQAQMGNYQLPQGPQSYLNQNPYMEYDPRYSMPQQVLPGSFGNAPFQFSFGPTPYNQPPIQTA